MLPANIIRATMFLFFFAFACHTCESKTAVRLSNLRQLESNKTQNPDLTSSDMSLQGCPLKIPGKPRCLIKMGRTNKAGINDITERLIKTIRIARSYGCGIQFASPHTMLGHVGSGKNSTWSTYYQTDEWACDEVSDTTNVTQKTLVGRPTMEQWIEVFRPDPVAEAAALAAGEKPRKAVAEDPLLILEWKMGAKKIDYYNVCQFWTCIWKRFLKHMICPQDKYTWCTNPPLPFIYLGDPIIAIVKKWISKFFHDKPYIALKIRRGDTIHSYPSSTCVDVDYAKLTAIRARERSFMVNGNRPNQIFIMSDASVKFLTEIKNALNSTFDTIVIESDIKGNGDASGKYMTIERLAQMAQVYAHITSKFRRFKDIKPLETIGLAKVSAADQIKTLGHAVEYLHCSKENRTEGSRNGLMITNPPHLFTSLDVAHHYDLKANPGDAFKFPRAQIPHLY